MPLSVFTPNVSCGEGSSINYAMVVVWGEGVKDFVTTEIKSVKMGVVGVEGLKMSKIA